MVARNEIFWVTIGGASGRRPVCVLTRDAAITVLNAVTCAPITRTIRGIPTEVEVGPEHGLPDVSVISCDSVVTVPLRDFDAQAVGRLDPATRARLDTALRLALDIRY